MMDGKKANNPEIRQSLISESETQKRHAARSEKALLQRKLAERTAEFEETHGGDGE